MVFATISLMLLILLAALTYRIKEFPVPLQGVILTTVISLPVTVLFVLFFRFPAPFAGMVGPVDAVEIMGELSDLPEVLSTAGFLWLLHLGLGGFIVLSIFGAISGVLVERRYKNSKQNKLKALIMLSVVSCVIPILILSTSDYIIGPWKDN